MLICLLNSNIYWLIQKKTWYFYFGPSATYQKIYTWSNVYAHWSEIISVSDVCILLFLFQKENLNSNTEIRIIRSKQNSTFSFWLEEDRGFQLEDLLVCLDYYTPVVKPTGSQSFPHGRTWDSHLQVPISRKPDAPPRKVHCQSPAPWMMRPREDNKSPHGVSRTGSKVKSFCLQVER